MVYTISVAPVGFGDPLYTDIKQINKNVSLLFFLVLCHKGKYYVSLVNETSFKIAMANLFA